MAEEEELSNVEDTPVIVKPDGGILSEEELLEIYRATATGE